MTPLLGFSPDVEPTTPGAIMECQNLIPDPKGMRSAPSAADAGLSALAAACRGAAVTRNLSGNSRLFAGTAADLYELGGTAWSALVAYCLVWSGMVANYYDETRSRRNQLRRIARELGIKAELPVNAEAIAKRRRADAQKTSAKR